MTDNPYQSPETEQAQVRQTWDQFSTIDAVLMFGNIALVSVILRRELPSTFSILFRLSVIVSLYLSSYGWIAYLSHYVYRGRKELLSPAECLCLTPLCMLLVEPGAILLLIHVVLGALFLAPYITTRRRIKRWTDRLGFYSWAANCLTFWLVTFGPVE
ncbi:MAG: hypothetical protein KDA60_21110 [Planctomycetales bacterium]|nr:hypothetical protein [Planctomycetales bacterium]